jgi:hypothetical protein
VVSITPLPRFTPGERTSGTHCTGGWVGPRAGLDTEARGKILCPRQGSNPDPARSQTLYCLSYPAPNSIILWQINSSADNKKDFMNPYVTASTAVTIFHVLNKQRLGSFVTRRIPFSSLLFVCPRLKTEPEMKYSRRVLSGLLLFSPKC